MSPIETLSQQITAKSNAGYHEIARKIKDAAELDAVRREWEQMAATSATIAAGFDYQKAWADGLASRQQLHVFLAAGGIAPLVRARGFAQPLTLLAAEMYEPLDFLYRTPQAVEELLMLIRRTALPLYLQRIPAASPIVTFVEKIFERRALIVRKPAAASPLIRLDESWIEPESHLNSGRRSDLRRGHGPCSRPSPLRVLPPVLRRRSSLGPPAYLPATHRGTECGRTDCHPDAHALFAIARGLRRSVRPFFPRKSAHAREHPARGSRRNRHL